MALTEKFYAIISTQYVEDEAPMAKVQAGPFVTYPEAARSIEQAEEELGDNFGYGVVEKRFVRAGE